MYSSIKFFHYRLLLHYKGFDEKESSYTNIEALYGQPTYFTGKQINHKMMPKFDNESIAPEEKVTGTQRQTLSKVLGY